MQAHAREADLAQGPMTVADLLCAACGSELGWVFVADLAGHNPHFVKRYGLVLGAWLGASVRAGGDIDEITRRFKADN